LKKACFHRTCQENCLFMVDFVNNVRSFVNYAIFRELCDRMRFEVDCAKSHPRVISEGLVYGFRKLPPYMKEYVYFCCGLIFSLV